jgi:DNA-binding NtrC family response regulator
MPHALAVDDDPNFLNALAELIEAQGFTTNTATTLQDARERLLHKRPDIALIDLRLPDGSGMELLRELERTRTTEVIMITGHADVDSAVEALRIGATDYLTKPLDMARLKEILARVAQEDLSLTPETSPVEEAEKSGRLGLLLGASEVMLDVYRQMVRVAPTDATVFFIGESGTGKDVASQTLHALSARSEEAYLPLNCGAITPTLIESELFGHERGSFTGANKRHKGYFERAHDGTLFLDEISEMPIELQVKLLRVLETGELVRIGGDQTVEVDVRVLAATNRDPHEAMREGKLREDLLYRLSVFPIHMPPLRERGDDVDLLADFFLTQLNEQTESEKGFSDDARETLRAYPWPGNVRELKNVVHRAFIMADDEVDAACLPSRMRGGAGGARNLSLAVGTSIADAERRLILATLEQQAGDKKRTADLLGVSLKTLYNRLNAYKEAGESIPEMGVDDAGDDDG